MTLFIWFFLYKFLLEELNLDNPSENFKAFFFAMERKFKKKINLVASCYENWIVLFDSAKADSPTARKGQIWQTCCGEYPTGSSILIDSRWLPIQITSSLLQNHTKSKLQYWHLVSRRLNAKYKYFLCSLLRAFFFCHLSLSLPFLCSK